MELFRVRLAADRVLVADGAMGTMLMERGLQPGSSPEAFNLDRPDALEEIAREYLNAGAEIIQTNTFGGSRLKLAQYSLGDRVAQINEKAVQAVRRAVKSNAYVSGSCGPTGQFLKPYGEVEPAEMMDVFREQIGVLVSSGVDIICVETMSDLGEATSAVKAAKEIGSIPVMATMTFDQTPKGFYTIMGVTIEQAVKALEAAGADVVGSNCGNGIDNMVSIAGECRKFTRLPIIIQSNAGIPELKGDVAVYPETPEFMAGRVKDLLDAGVSIIGGCCGTTPAHIRAIREAVDAHKHS
ncbi:MAG: homocysteine S-methyltransferase family protein [candidate division WOR-3 bacterium]|nr:MAG: homocysteine S-methyltransferase family protein [candidate division WOR-3 bacterium]